MKMPSRTLLIVLSLLLLAGAAVAAGGPEGKAKAAAGKWLKLVDNGDYAKSWDEAASFFREKITAEEWSRAVAAARGPFGKVLRRTVKSMQYTKSLPGAPDGEYVVIQYDTSFEKKKSAIETVTPMLDSEGKWRVSGYYIR